MDTKSTFIKPIKSIISIGAEIFLSSKDNIVNLSKLLILSGVVLILFLYASGYIFPGGAIHYNNWASSIIEGKKLPLSHAQREVGMPILYILTGYTYFKSFIGITLAYGVFGVLIVLANYVSISNVSTSVAYYSSVFLIATLAPFSYIKFFYPDQLYIFLIQMFLMYMMLFLWKEKLIYLYVFAIFAICASLTRTSGNLLFVSLIVILFLLKRTHLKHYIACLAIGIAVFGINQIHRYDIFNLSNLTDTKPVGKGYQILYSTYMWMGQFGYKISPELGPNSKLLIQRMREELSPSPRHSKLVANLDQQTPVEFMEENVYKYSTEELIDKVLTEPCEEYFYNIIFGIKRVGITSTDTDDEFQLNIVKEIWFGYPLYILKYGFRNLGLMLFDPGWSSPRYVKAQFSRQGLEFVGGGYGWGAFSADSVAGLGDRAAREHEFYQFRFLPNFIQATFFEIKEFHLKHFRSYVYVTSLIMILAWILTIVFYMEKVVGRKLIKYSLSEDNLSKVCMAIVLISFVLLYENAMTAWFSQPHFRYFHMTESCRFMLVGFAIVLILKMNLLDSISIPIRIKNYFLFLKSNNAEGMLISKRRLIFFSIIIMQCVALSYWAQDVIKNTWGEQQISITRARYESSDGEVVPVTEKEKNETLNCIYFRCEISLAEGSKLHELNRTKPWNLSVDYLCRNRGDKRTAVSKKNENFQKLDLTCY